MDYLLCDRNLIKEDEKKILFRKSYIFSKNMVQFRYTKTTSEN